MKKLILIAAVALVALSGCSGGAADEKKPDKPAAGKPKDAAVKVDASLHNVAGRWKGDAAADGKFVILDLASDGQVTMEIRRTGEKGEEVFETASGKATLSGTTLEGTLSKASPTTGALSKVSTWKATVADKKGQLVAGGANYNITWTGL